MPYLVMGYVEGNGTAGPSINLQHFDSSLADDSSVGRTWTANNGSPTYSTAEKQFGTASIDLGGDSVYLSTSATADTNPWTATTFSLECWINVPDYSNKQYVGGQPTLFGNMDANGTTNFWSFGITSDGYARFYYYNGAAQYVTGTTPVGTNAWVHLKVNIDGSNIYVFRDGNLDATGANGGDQAYNGATLVLGRHANINFTGYVDEFRITRDQTIETSSFTPPAAPYNE